jgi:hypothetical protein
MVSLPRDISPGAAARRSLLADFLIALALALLAFQFAAGIGVVGFLALLAALIILLWIFVEAIVRRGRGRRGSEGGRTRSAQPHRACGQGGNGVGRRP